MPSLFERQADFGAALLDPERAVPEGLVGPDGRPSARRFAVYRNNVVSSLIDALAEAYPIVQRLVGEAFFRATARVFVTDNSPDSPVMLRYGAGFADFLDGFAPLADLPYIGDVARVERAYLASYHAPEATALTVEAMVATAPETLLEMSMVLHPSCRIVTSDYPVGTIWHTNNAAGTPDPINLAAGGETVLIARPEARVDLRLLPEGPAQFLLSLGAGHSLSRAAEAALRTAPDQDVSALLSGVIRLGLIVGLQPVACESAAARD
ncbi:DNA-binding domain-containing protein [Thioclava sp.]|uniref:HvfC/BufC N-terminal domain-containing protein n=1 Tax=Thioclava sp. TaxID=1933450 RepID=UPI003AA8CFCB